MFTSKNFPSLIGAGLFALPFGLFFWMLSLWKPHQEVRMANESDASLKMTQQAFAIGAAFWLGMCFVLLNPLSYVPFWSAPERKGPAR